MFLSKVFSVEEVFVTIVPNDYSVFNFFYANIKLSQEKADMQK